MKIQETIENLKYLISIENLKYLISDDCTDNQMDFVEEIKMAINALEKQVPKIPIEDGYYDEPAVCPNCGCNVVKFVDNYCSVQFCHFCGQKLDLSDHPTEKGGVEE